MMTHKHGNENFVFTVTHYNYEVLNGIYYCMSVLSLYIESTDSMILFLLMPVSYLKMTTITHNSSSDHQDERIELWSFYNITCTKNTFYADEVPWEIILECNHFGLHLLNTYYSPLLYPNHLFSEEGTYNLYTQKVLVNMAK